jgi:phytoene dehydrogenase-like protein
MTNQQNVSRSIRELYVTDGERTFHFDNQLPSLPLPKLRDTLTRYLESVRHLVDHSDWERTRTLVKKFETGAGTRLQAYLESKADKEKNWVSSVAFLFIPSFN